MARNKNTARKPKAYRKERTTEASRKGAPAGKFSLADITSHKLTLDIAPHLLISLLTAYPTSTLYTRALTYLDQFCEQHRTMGNDPKVEEIALQTLAKGLEDIKAYCQSISSEKQDSLHEGP